MNSAHQGTILAVLFAVAMSLGSAPNASAESFNILWQKYGGKSAPVAERNQPLPLPPPIAERVRKPSEPTPQRVLIDRKLGNRFLVDGLVNGRNIEFVVDTGATTVAFTKADAERLGVTVHKLSYLGMGSTPGGATPVYRLPLTSVNVQGIIVRDIQAVVVPESTGRSLLGMTFLNRLKSFGVENGVMYLESAD